MTLQLTEPQELARQHLLANKEAALFMGCGLGKTLTCLKAMEELFIDGASRGALIVAPVRVCNLTWPHEVAKWSELGLTVANLRTKEGQTALLNEDAHLYVINYEQLQSFATWYLKGRRRYAFDTVIWDELTYAKNYKSKRINAVRGYFRKKLIRHWGLTGTPASNSLMDLFAQVRLLDNGERLGKSFSMFRETYFYPTDFNRYNWAPRENARGNIYKRLEGFAATFTREDWLDIPEIVEEDLEVTLVKEAREKYLELETEFITQLKEDEIVAVNKAVLSGKLQQMTSGAVYTEDGSFQVVHRHKIVALKNLLKDRQPTLVAYSYKHERARLRDEVPGIVFFDEATTQKKQEELCRKWNAGEIPVLAAHPASLGHGLNLQDGGSRVIWFSLTWSRDLYEQLIARVARKGQTEPTKIIRIIAKDSIDYAIAESLRSKDREQTALLDALKVFYGV